MAARYLEQMERGKSGCTNMDEEINRVNQIVRLALDVKPDKQNLQQAMDLPPAGVLDNETAARIYVHKLSREYCAAPSGRGDFYTLRVLARLMCDLLDIRDGSVYDPCCGSGSLLFSVNQTLAKRQLYGQTGDIESYHMCRMNFFLHNLSIDLGGRPADTLTEDLHIDRKFDIISANVPFNQSHWRNDRSLSQDDRWKYGLPPDSNANYAWLQHIVSHLDEKGLATVILPNGSLTTQNQKERIIRQGLLEDGLIEAIIALPSGLFYNTKVPCCIWVINKARTPESTILMVDARRLTLGKKAEETQDASMLSSLVLRHRNGMAKEKTDWYAVASLEEISQKNYSLSPNLYTKIKPIPVGPIRQRQERFLLLTDRLCSQLKNSDLYPYICQWKDMQVTKCWEKAFLLDLYQPFGGLTKKRDFFGDGIGMADVKTVIHHSFLPDFLPKMVKATEEEIKKYETIEQLACCCIVPEDRCAVYGNYIKCLRPAKKPVPSPYYMAGYFRSAVYRHEIERVSPVYTTRANMNVERLSEVLVYYPEKDLQDKLGETLFAVFSYRKTCRDEAVDQLLREFEKLLIEQFITYPILCVQEGEGNK